MGFLLFVVSFLLVGMFAPIGILFTTIKSMIAWNKNYINEYYLCLAISLDQFGNVVMAGLFNIIMINSSSIHLFGNPDETISSVIGKNKRDNTLFFLGYPLDWILNKIEKDHSINAIEQEK
jgi:8-oxo-dGTP diphosphatase